MPASAVPANCAAGPARPARLRPGADGPSPRPRPRIPKFLVGTSTVRARAWSGHPEQAQAIPGGAGAAAQPSRGVARTGGARRTSAAMPEGSTPGLTRGARGTADALQPTTAARAAHAARRRRAAHPSRCLSEIPAESARVPAVLPQGHGPARDGATRQRGRTLQQWSIPADLRRGPDSSSVAAQVAAATSRRPARPFAGAVRLDAESAAPAACGADRVELRARDPAQALGLARRRSVTFPPPRSSSISRRLRRREG